MKRSLQLLAVAAVLAFAAAGLGFRVDVDSISAQDAIAQKLQKAINDKQFVKIWPRGMTTAASGYPTAIAADVVELSDQRPGNPGVGVQYVIVSHIEILTVQPQPNVGKH